MPKTTLIDCCIKKYAYREVSQIYQELEISEEGLSQSQVELMREKYGIYGCGVADRNTHECGILGNKVKE